MHKSNGISTPRELCTRCEKWLQTGCVWLKCVWLKPLVGMADFSSKSVPTCRIESNPSLSSRAALSLKGAKLQCSRGAKVQ
jgi:hypothetical protein